MDRATSANRVGMGVALICRELRFFRADYLGQSDEIVGSLCFYRTNAAKDRGSGFVRVSYGGCG